MRPKTQIWLHKPTNTRRHVGGTNGSAFLMCSGSHDPIYATEAELNNAELWSRV